MFFRLIVAFGAFAIVALLFMNFVSPRVYDAKKGAQDSASTLLQQSFGEMLQPLCSPMAVNSLGMASLNNVTKTATLEKVLQQLSCQQIDSGRSYESVGSCDSAEEKEDEFVFFMGEGEDHVEAGKSYTLTALPVGSDWCFKLEETGNG